MRLKMKRTRDHLESAAQHRASVTLTGLSPSMTLEPTCAAHTFLMTRPSAHEGHAGHFSQWKGCPSMTSASSVLAREQIQGLCVLCMLR